MSEDKMIVYVGNPDEIDFVEKIARRHVPIRPIYKGLPLKLDLEDKKISSKKK